MDDTDSEPNQISDEESYSSDESSTNESLSDNDDAVESDHNDENNRNESRSEHDDDSDESDFEDEKDIDLKPTSAPRLEVIASVSVAIALWKSAKVKISGFVTNQSDWWRSSREEVPKWADQLPVPKSLSECIKDRFQDILSNADKWVRYHFRAAYLERGDSSYLYRHVDRIVWNPNGTTSCKGSARNLLESEALTNAEKYRFACTYCLKEDIEKLWPFVDYDDVAVGEGQFSKYPLIYYWNCYCANELGKVPLLENLSIDVSMIRYRYVDNWPAKEYFFERLSAEEQVVNAIWLIDKYSIDYQKLLLIKLNESQRLHVYMERFKDIILNYVCTDFHEENGISAWYDVRDLITRDQFVSLCNEIIETNHDGIVLTEILTSACDDYKRQVLIYDDYDFIIKAMNVWISKRENKYRRIRDVGFNFLSSVLRGYAIADIKRDITKEDFFLQLCRYLVRGDELDLESLDRMINLCLPEAGESAKFKLSLTKHDFFAEHCKSLMIDYRLQKLDRLLNLCLPKTDPESRRIAGDILKSNLKYLDELCLISLENLDELNDLLAPLVSSYPEIILDYKSNLLLSEIGIRACSYYFGLSKDALVRIIKDGLPTSKLAAEFKKRIIFSDEGINELQNLILDGHYDYAGMETFISWFLKSNKEKKKLKTRLVRCLKQRMRRIDSMTKKNAETL